MDRRRETGHGHYIIRVTDLHERVLIVVGQIGRFNQLEFLILFEFDGQLVIQLVKIESIIESIKKMNG